MRLLHISTAASLLALLVWQGRTGACASACGTPADEARVAGSVVAVPRDTTTKVMEDTLKEVIIEGTKELPIMDQFRKDLQRNKQPHTKSLGDLLNKAAPQLQDQMMHPLAIKQRKEERHRKRAAKILKDFDAKVPEDTIKSRDQKLFEEIVRKQREEDEKKGMTNWQKLDKK